MSAAEGWYGYMLGPSVFNWVNHQCLQKWCYILVVVMVTAQASGMNLSFLSLHRQARVWA